MSLEGLNTHGRPAAIHHTPGPDRPPDQVFECSIPCEVLDRLAAGWASSVPLEMVGNGLIMEVKKV